MAATMHQTEELHRHFIRRTRSRKQKPALLDAAKQFGSNIRPTAAEVTAFKDQFYTLIFQLGSEEQKDIATAIANSHYTPRSVAIYFCLSEAKIAAPMLMFSPVLSTTDLNSIIKKRAKSHVRITARRNDIEASTVELLLSYPDEREMTRELLKRNGSLSKNEQIQALLNMPAEAFDSSVFEPPLIKKRVESYVQSDNKEIEEIQNEPVSILEETTTEEVATVSSSPNEQLMQLANKGGRISSERGKTSFSQTDSIEQFETQLLDCARQSNRSALAQSIERRCHLPVEKFTEIVTQQDAGKLASLFCALGVRKLAASQLLLLLNRNVGRDIAVFKSIQSEYEQLRKSECQAMFEYSGARFGNMETSTPVETPETDLALALRNRRGSFSSLPIEIDTISAQELRPAISA